MDAISRAKAFLDVMGAGQLSEAQVMTMRDHLRDVLNEVELVDRMPERDGSIGAAREWLRRWDAETGGQGKDVAVCHLRAVLEQVAPMGRRAHEMGTDWLLTNIEDITAEAIAAGNEHRHHDEGISLKLAHIRALVAVAAAIRDGMGGLEATLNRIEDRLIREDR